MGFVIIVLFWCYQRSCRGTKNKVLISTIPINIPTT